MPYYFRGEIVPCPLLLPKNSCVLAVPLVPCVVNAAGRDCSELVPFVYFFPVFFPSQEVLHSVCMQFHCLGRLRATRLRFGRFPCCALICRSGQAERIGPTFVGLYFDHAQKLGGTDLVALLWCLPQSAAAV